MSSQDPDAITSAPDQGYDRESLESIEDVEGDLKPVSDEAKQHKHFETSASGALKFKEGTKLGPSQGSSAYVQPDKSKSSAPPKPSPFLRFAEITGLGVGRSKKEKKIQKKAEKDQKKLFGDNDPNKPGTEESGKKMSDKEAKAAQERAGNFSKNPAKRWYYKCKNKAKGRRGNTTDVDESAVAGTGKK